MWTHDQHKSSSCGKNTRSAEENKGSSLTNSQLGFIFEFGAPEAHIPARPSLFPTVQANLDIIKQYLNLAMSYAVQGQIQETEQSLHALGMILTAALKKRILDFIPPPLRPRTLRKWITQDKRRRDYGTTPLVVTGEFLNSLGYVVEHK